MIQYIVFRVHNQKFAISIQSTSRIIPVSEITNVPDLADFILGVMEYEEQNIPVIDVQKRFFDRNLKVSNNSQILVVYWNDQEVGLAVDEVISIVHFDDSQIDSDLEKITSLDHAAEKTPVKSFIRNNNGIILELNVNDLFDMEGSLQIQALIESYIE